MREMSEGEGLVVGEERSGLEGRGKGKVVIRSNHSHTLHDVGWSLCAAAIKAACCICMVRLVAYTR